MRFEIFGNAASRARVSSIRHRSCTDCAQSSASKASERISTRSRHRESDVRDGLLQPESYCRALTTAHANALVRNTKVDADWRPDCSADNIGGSNDERTPFRNVMALSIVRGCPSIFLKATPEHRNRS